MATIVALLDHDDEEWLEVCKLLRGRGHDISALRLGGRDLDIDIHLTFDDFVITQGDVVVDIAKMRRAAVVIYRRWRMAKLPIVCSTLTDAAERTFAQREWDAAMAAALRMAEEESRGAVWCNRFSCDPIAGDKMTMLRSAVRVGLRVPETTVATVPAPPCEAVVAKSVNIDEAIDDRRAFKTTVLSKELLEAYGGQRGSCPTLLQRRVSAAQELRVVVIGDAVEVIEQRVDGAYDDIRYVESDRIARRAVSCPEPLAAALRRLMPTLGLQYCTFDLLEEDGQYALVDITPNGMWSPFETDEAQLTARVADIVHDWAISGARL